MSRFSVKKPFTIFVAVVAILVFGIISYRNMTPDLLPNMDFPYVVVITTCPGATPEQVETIVTKPMEQSFATLNNLKTVSSNSSENYSLVSLEFEQNTPMDSVMVDMLQAVQTLSEGWDDTVGAPYILRINPSMIPVVVSAVARDGFDRYEMAQFTEETLIPALEGTTGVASITAGGLVDRTLTVKVTDEKLDATNERIAKALTASLQEALDKLNDAQKEIDDAKATLESSTWALQNAPSSMLGGMADSGAVEELEQLLSDTVTTSAEISAAQARQEALEAERQIYEDNLATLENELAQWYVQLSNVRTERAILAQALEAGQSAGDDTPLSELELDGVTLLSLQTLGCATMGDVRTRDAALEAQEATLTESYNAASAAVEEARAAAELRIPEIDQEISATALELLELQSQAAVNAEKIAKLQSGLEAVPGQLMSGITQLSLAGGQLAAAQAGLATAQETLDGAFDTYDQQLEAALKAADLHSVMTLETVSALIGAQNFDMPAGYVYEDGVGVVVTVGDKLRGTEELENLVLMDLGINGLNPIRLRDVAELVYADNADEIYATLNGSDGIILMFSKQSNYATARVADNIQNKFRQLSGEYPGLTFTSLMDQGDYIYLMRDSILSSLLWGALFSVVVLFLFLQDWRPTVITLLSIPISLLFALTLMYFSGVSINIMSLSGLAISVGMLVDNSVVVIENTYRLRSLGESPMKSAVSGAGQVAGAVAASTITNVCVFVPVLFTNGLARQLFTDMMLTLSFALLASLVVSLTLVPAMAGKLLRTEKKPKGGLFERIMPGYRRSVRWAVGHKAVVLSVVVALFLGSTGLLLSKGLNFLPEMEMEQMIAYMTMPEDASFAETAAMADEVAHRILSVDGVGTVGGMVQDSSGGLGAISMGVGDVSYYVLMDESTKRSGREITADIEASCADLDCEVVADSSSLMSTYSEMLAGSGVTVRLYGSELHSLQEGARQVAGALLTVEGVTASDAGIVDPSPELHFTVDKVRAAEKGLTVAQVYQKVAVALAGEAELMDLKDGGLTWKVIVCTRDQTRITPDYIRELTFTVTDKLGEEQTVALTDVAEVEWTETLSTISRINQRRYLDVTAQVAEDKNVTLVTDACEKLVKELELPEGVTAAFSGERETIMDAMKDLLILMLVGILLVYLVMVAQFQNLKSPFIVMFTIPLAFTGAFLGLLLFGLDLNVLSVLGLIMLVGIIVNNGIVLVDYVNQLRAGGMECVDAIEDAAVTRLRPILMTSITTILGLLVMALGKNEATSLIQPLAITCMGGLIYGTLLTLYVVPVMYDIFAKKDVYTVAEEDLILSDK